MSTRSAIIQKTETGKYEGIYCHFDGYVKGVGQTLLDHYQDEDKVKRLIALGDVSSLGERVEPTGPHSYGKPEAGVTVAYIRDRGEDPKGILPKRGNSADAVAKQIGHNEYVYVFQDGQWTCNGKDLAEAILEAVKAAA